MTPHPFVKDIVLTWFQHDFLTAADLYFKRSILGWSCGSDPSYHHNIYLSDHISVDSYRFDEDEDPSFYVFEHENVTLSKIVSQWPIQPFRIVLFWFFEDYVMEEILPFKTIAKNINKIGDILGVSDGKPNHIVGLLQQVDINVLKEIRSLTKNLSSKIAEYTAFSATSVYWFNKTLDKIIQSKGFFARTKRKLLNTFSRPTDELLGFVVHPDP